MNTCSAFVLYINSNLRFPLLQLTLHVPNPFWHPPPPSFLCFVILTLLLLSWQSLIYLFLEHCRKIICNFDQLQVTYIYICVIFTFNNCYHSQCQDWKEIFLCINIYYMQPKLVLVFKKNWQEYERWIVNLYFWRNSSLYC